jgi:HSP20 family protein
MSKEDAMPVLRFDPFRDLDRLTEQMLGVPAGSARAPRFMPMDLYRTGDHYVLHADLPGVDPGSVDVNVDNGTLTIRAERSARSDESVQWIASERFTGSYMRQLSLGDGVDANGINATYENGVLTVTIPLAEVAKPRRIEVQASTAGTVITAPADQGQVTSS